MNSAKNNLIGNKMKRNMFNNRYGWLVMALMALMVLSVSSCKEDEEGMGTPVITAVRVCDPAKADSNFTKAGTGQQIAIIGQNLSKVQKVFINDQQVYFNPTMNTDHSVIVSIPTEDDGFVLTAFDSSLKDEIRVETSHGTAVYSFKVTAPYPSITRIQAMYPRKAGDLLNVYGLNLVDIEKVYFTDITAAQLDTTKWETVGGNHVEATSVNTVVSDHHINSRTQAYETTSQLGVVIPSLPYEKGALVIECAGGTTYIDFTVVPGMPVLNDISSDMPVLGEEVVLTGREFVQVESITYGDVTLTPDQFVVAESEDAIQFKMSQLPSQGGDGLLTVTTPGGKASILFYNYNCLLTSFDGDATDNGWDPNASYETATPDAAPFTSSGNYARITVESEAQQWWGKMVYFRKDWDGNSFALPSFDIIPATASADEVYLAMEVYNNNSDYNNGVFSGYIRYMIQPLDNSENQFDNFEWTDYDAGAFGNFSPVLGDINGEAPVGKWYRHVLPLSNIPCFAGHSYADIVTLGINQFRLQSINQGTSRGFIDVCLDNVRIFYKKK
jgi:hypothetical protein